MASQRVVFKDGRAVKKYVDNKEVSLPSKKKSSSSSKSIPTSPDVSDFGSRRGTAVKYDASTGMTSYIENGRVVLQEKTVAMWRGGMPAVSKSQTESRYVDPIKTKTTKSIIPSTFTTTVVRGATSHSIYKPDIAPNQTFVQSQIRAAQVQPTQSKFKEVIKERHVAPQSTMTAADSQPGIIGRAARKVEGYLQKKGYDYHTATRSVHPFAVNAARGVRGAVGVASEVVGTFVRGTVKLSTPYQTYALASSAKQISQGKSWLDTPTMKLATDKDVWTTVATVGTLGAAAKWKAAAVGMEVAGVGFGAHGVKVGLEKGTPEGIGEAIVWGVPTITSGIKLGKMAIRSQEFAGATFVPESEVWGSKVLAGEEKFPLVKSTSESLKMAETTKTSEGRYVLVSAGDQPFIGTTAGVGGRPSQLGLQDPGIYSFVKGSGSPEFTGIKSKDSTQIKFSLWDTSIEKPTLTEFEVAGLTRPSKKALETPGFEGVVEWQQSEVVGTGYAHISKRSMLGQSEIPKQKFKRKDGKTVIEKGTTEGEFIIPPDSKWQPVKTQSTKTTFKGEQVAIKRMRLLSESEFKSLSQKEQFSLLKNQKTYRNTYSSVYSKQSRTISFKPIVSTSYTSKTKPSSTSSSSSRRTSSTSSQPSSYISISGTTSNIGMSSTVTSSKGLVSKPVNSKVTSSKSLPISKISSSSISNYYKGGSSTSRGSSSSSLISRSGSVESYVERSTVQDPKPLQRLPKQKKKKKELYDVFVRRKGVFSKVGRVTGKDSALALGKHKISTSLAASFKVLKSSTGKAIKTNGLGKTIRKSKREEGVFVQKRTYRLSAGKEKSDIQQAKKKRLKL